MQFRTRLNLMLLVATGILLLVAVLEPDQQKEPVAPALTSRKGKEVQRVLIPRRDGKDILLARRPDGWWMEQPYQVRARTQRADALAGLVEAKSEASYPATSLNLVELQLEPPQAELQLDGQRFLFGGTDPLHYRRYVRLGDQVHLVEDSQYHHVAASAAELVDTALLDPQAEPVSIRLPTLELQRANGRWLLSPPQPEPSADAIQALVDEWRYARAAAVEPYAGGGGGNIDIGLAGRQAVVRLRILKQEPELVLARPELGLAYRFAPGSARRMLDLAEPAADTESADSDAGGDRVTAPGDKSTEDLETLPADVDAAESQGPVLPAESATR